MLGDPGPPPTPIWDESPWYAIAVWKDDGDCREVFMTWKYDAFAERWRATFMSGVRFDIWCGSFREVEDFRKRCQARPAVTP